jgi:aldehyde dehydrogenase (NAD+)
MTDVMPARTTRPELFNKDALFIGGRWTRRSDRESLEIVDPYSEQVIGTVPAADAQDAEEAIQTAVKAFESNPWQKMSLIERGEVLKRVGDELVVRSDDLVETYIHDMGGLRTFGQYMAVTGQAIFAEHAEFARRLSEDDSAPRVNGNDRTMVLREPVGPVLAIVPWNGQVALGAVKIAPALLAGCPVVVKVDHLDPTASFVIAEALEAAGVPEGMVSILPGSPQHLGDIVSRPEFRHISFTGSSATGRHIMSSAAKNITGVTLELGGKSAGIMLEDFDPATAGPIILPGCLAQSGQVCTTYSRLLVPASREQAWRDALVAIFEGLTIGDPDDLATNFGPLITDAHRQRVAGYVDIARNEGATILTGGGPVADQPTGYFYAPTLIGDVDSSMRIVREEVFGPVITVQTYNDLDDAVAQANATDFGLAAGVFTQDIDLGVSLGRRLEAGNVSINNFGACLLQPFGGYKTSGLGREGGLEGVLEHMEIKQIRIPAS